MITLARVPLRGLVVPDSQHLAQLGLDLVEPALAALAASGLLPDPVW
jgi:hypothetical protein